MPQLSYPLAPNPGMPGLMFDNERSNADIVQIIAGAVIPPGVFCETVLVSGQYLLFPLKDATTGGAFLPQLIGVSLLDVVGAEQSYVPYAVPNSGAGSSFAGYPIGFAVPVLRRGRIWVQWDGNTGNALPFATGTMNVIHSSTGANPQGVVTTKAVSATAGFEIDAFATPAGASKSVGLFDPRQLSGTYTDSFGTVTSMVPMTVNLGGS